MSHVPRLALGLAWGALAGFTLFARARRALLAERLGLPSRAVGAARRGRIVDAGRALVRRGVAATGPVARVVEGITARKRAHAAGRALERELPVAVDLLAVAVGAGCTPYL